MRTRPFLHIFIAISKMALSSADILSDQISGITVFLPSNDAINTTLEKFGLDFDGLLKNQGLCTQIMEYHILPSPIEVSFPHMLWLAGHMFQGAGDGHEMARPANGDALCEGALCMDGVGSHTL